MNIGLKHAISEIRKNYSSLYWWRNRVFVPYVVGTASRYHPYCPGYDDAVHVMEEDWDTLIVLDACRTDTFQEVADLSRFDDYSTQISLGSHSSEWTKRNFGGRQFNDTVYVSANPHTSLEAANSFHKIIKLWETETDKDAGVVFPESVKDAAIEAYRENTNKRFIVHFMQPHGPFIGSDNTPPYTPGEEYETVEEYWRDYEENLEYVLPYAFEVANEIPGKTVVTSDHGQIFSKGFKHMIGISSHPPRLRFPELVRVPWAILHGRRRRIESGQITKSESNDLKEHLEALGYN